MKVHESGRWEKLVQGRPADAQGWSACAGLTLAEAEQLLDWLEANGFPRREATLVGGEEVTVRWRRDPAG